MKILSLLFLFLLPEFLSACSCAGISNFCETSRQNQKIVEIKIISKSQDANNNHYIDIEIVEVLLDKSGSITKFMTIVEPNTSCDIGVYWWAEIGDRYVMTFSDSFNYEGANFPGLFFSLCSTNFLQIENNFVRGVITRTNGREERLRYSKFKKMLSNLCEIETLDEKDIFINTLIENRLLVIKNNNQSRLEYHIFDRAGKLILSKTIDPDENQEVDLYDLIPGLYYINFRTEKDQITKKFIVS